MARQPNDTIDMYNLHDSNDSNEERPHRDAEMNQTPTNADPNRPPQLNLGNTSCHCNCGCACGTGGNDDGDGTIAHALAAEVLANGIYDAGSYNHYASSEPGDNPINGQEGDEHMIEVGDLGPISCRTVIRDLARHCRCTCGRRPTVMNDPDTTYVTPIDSGMMSPTDSMIVDTSSADQSMISSQALSMPSRGSSVYLGIGGVLTQEAIMQRFPVLFQPLPLTPEVPVIPFEYPLTLSITAAELEHGMRRDEDFW